MAPASRSIRTILRLVVPRTIESSITATRLPVRMWRCGWSLRRTPKCRMDCWGSMKAHASIAKWLKARDVAVIGSDGVSDVMPSNVEGRLNPLHELVLVGRLGNLINVKGKKVNPREVERVISELCAVEEVKVVGVAKEKTGDQSVRAVIACRPGSLTSDEVRAWCRGRLSSFKTPRSILLVDHIPRDNRGKIGRALLAHVAGNTHTRDLP